MSITVVLKEYENKVEGSSPRLRVRAPVKPLCILFFSCFFCFAFSKMQENFVFYIFAGKKASFDVLSTCKATSLMPRSHIRGFDAGLATATILHHPWQSVLVRIFPYCIRNHT